MDKLFVKNEHLIMLNDIFNSYCPKAEIWAYGSRVNGDAHDGSDLDLTVIDFGDKRCSIADLKSIFSDSNIPFLIDINEFKTLPVSFQDEIKRNNVIIFPVSNKI